MYLLVIIRKYRASIEYVIEKVDTPIGNGTYEYLNQGKSVIGLICLKARYDVQVSDSLVVKDVLGIVVALVK